MTPDITEDTLERSESAAFSDMVLEGLLRQTLVQAVNRLNLRELLSVANGA